MAKNQDVRRDDEMAFFRNGKRRSPDIRMRTTSHASLKNQVFQYFGLRAGVRAVYALGQHPASH